MELKGKGMFVWQLEALFNGSLTALVDSIHALGLSWVAVRVADGTLADNEHVPEQGAVALSRILHAAGIGFCAWQAAYGNYPDLEAAMALKRIGDTQADAFMVDAEGAWNTTLYPQKADAAVTYMKALGAPGIPVALCSYRYPDVHQEFPFKAFLDNGITHHAPQVYYVTTPENVASINAVFQLNKSMTQLKLLKDLPFIPVGAAYHESTVSNGVTTSWTVSAQAITDFGVECNRLNLPYSYWEYRYLLEPDKLAWYTAVKDLPSIPVNMPPFPSPTRLTDKVLALEAFRAKVEEYLSKFPTWEP